MGQTPLSVFGMRSEKATAASILRSTAHREERLADMHDNRDDPPRFVLAHSKNAVQMSAIADRISTAELPEEGVILPGCGFDGDVIGACGSKYFLKLVR